MTKFNVDDLLICHNIEFDCDPIVVVYRGPSNIDGYHIVYDKVSGSSWPAKTEHLRPITATDLTQGD